MEHRRMVRLVPKGILFIIDCLRYDAFPAWAIKNHTITKFETAYNTPLTFNSILAGRNLYGTVPYNRDAMFQLYRTPVNPSLLQQLQTQDVNCYLRSDEPLISKHAWWTKHTSKYNGGFMREPCFLLWHTYKTHAVQGRVSTKAMRHKIYLQYLRRIEQAFKTVHTIIQRERPQRYIIMGDHGEEFYLDKEDPAMWGHGTFDQPITTDNVKYTGLLSNTNKHIESFSELYEEILSWYQKLQ